MLVFVTLWAAAPASARDPIRVVGSSTVYPFATLVAEEFGRSTRFKTPIIEQTGTGGGLKLFCAGVGMDHPDVANASRPIKASEVASCARNGVDDIAELRFGYDGIVLASAKTGEAMDLTRRHVFLALAKTVPTPSGAFVPNPYRTWDEIDATLPRREIRVLGPPPTSGTRDAFNELVLAGGCETFPELARLRRADEVEFRRSCHAIREDGVYVQSGESDDRVVQQLLADPDALGVLGFAFVEENDDALYGSRVDGYAPTLTDITNGHYPLSRSLYLYVKGAHLGRVPGMVAYLREFASERASGEYGYLATRGLIPASADDRARVRDAVRELELPRPTAAR